ncbi:ABC transporter permease [Escherichia coli]|uniref:ABC transporter permease n=1 Tax=Escherichia coli TaxID=562 RepID=UPI00183B6C23|nr:ABC transporter permease [Escherichia coli]HBK0888933.1 ABC transporter permease [Escherichia coli]HCP5145149.1 ABC transporter permease [Escherichia coli]HDT4945561.1 ABC transporter permease [Escherichia coli]
MYHLFFLILKESLQNIQENKNMMYLYLFVLILSFTGVIITDSLINSVSKTAQSELRDEGDSIITINFHVPKSRYQMAAILSQMEIKDMYFSKRIFFQVGENPFATQLKKITGIESKDVLLSGAISDFGIKDKNSVAIRDNESFKKKFIYINGIPFKVHNIAAKKKTNFLDSLGLSSLQEDGGFFIPLETALRLSLSNEIDSVKLLLKKEVDDSVLLQLRELLKKNGVNDYSVISFIDAKKIVDNVLNRFSLLTNIMYFFLTVTSVITAKSMSKKMFQYRSTEFALKILNGINGKIVCFVILMESIIVALFSLLMSLLVSFFTLITVSNIISVKLIMRYDVLGMSVFIIVFFLCVYNIRLSYSLFSKDLSILIKERFS